MLKVIMLLICLVPIVSCQKNSFESCVEYYEKKAKEDYPSGDWKSVAKFNIDSHCGNNANKQW